MRVRLLMPVEPRGARGAARFGFDWLLRRGGEARLAGEADDRVDLPDALVALENLPDTLRGAPPALPLFEKPPNDLPSAATFSLTGIGFVDLWPVVFPA